ncbi:MAG: hypothetical protein GX790_04660 [Syntrophomonadaceae bacterium]|nr:hypothetical protein [Syntrophomonadaceae bacterium]
MSKYFEPINYVRGKAKIPLRIEDIMDYDVYEDMWLENDDKETDIRHLIEQNRIR